jgi:hypothetical protein
MIARFMPVLLALLFFMPLSSSAEITEQGTNPMGAGLL